MSFDAYLRQIRAKLATGEAREGAHRAALETLLESLAPGVTAVNEPKHVARWHPSLYEGRLAPTRGGEGVRQAKPLKRLGQPPGE